MNRYIKLFPLGAVMALAAAGASAQTPAPAATASAPATMGRTAQEAAEANRKAVPRSDTGTVVRTSPSAADKAQDALNGSNTSSTPAGLGGTTTDRAAMRGAAANGAMPAAATRRPRADRN